MTKGNLKSTYLPSVQCCALCCAETLFIMNECKHLSLSLSLSLRAQANITLTCYTQPQSHPIRSDPSSINRGTKGNLIASHLLIIIIIRAIKPPPFHPQVFARYDIMLSLLACQPASAPAPSSSSISFVAVPHPFTTKQLSHQPALFLPPPFQPTTSSHPPPPPHYRA
jgi:hypothetical protein